FYGDTLRSITSWMYEHNKEKLVFGGVLWIFGGHYEKTAYGKTEQYDGMSARHHGWGVGTVEDPVMAPIIKTGLKAITVIKRQAFIGLYCDYRNELDQGNNRVKCPKFLHGELECHPLGRFAAGGGGVDEKRTVTFSQIVNQCGHGYAHFKKSFNRWN
ncbi:MAG: hypothetical protein KJP18_14620, partial [Gemmatimonadetes bacterium]|nr:hypothetical protein [Gemmatimonadota bacterium]